MENSSRYFKNEKCEYYPCHQGMEDCDFNCLFCYCPMNQYEDCLGMPEYITTSAGTVIKDCSGCTYPHEPQNYDHMMEFLSRKMSEK